MGRERHGVIFPRLDHAASGVELVDVWRVKLRRGEHGDSVIATGDEDLAIREWGRLLVFPRDGEIASAVPDAVRRFVELCAGENPVIIEAADEQDLAVG